MKKRRTSAKIRRREARERTFWKRMFHAIKSKPMDVMFTATGIPDSIVGLKLDGTENTTWDLGTVELVVKPETIWTTTRKPIISHMSFGPYKPSKLTLKSNPS